jgi:Icc-related predicted phosphoesterase
MIRIAAVSDLHCTLGDEDKIAARFHDVNDRADILLLPGDITDHGSLDEAQTLADGLSAVKLPILAVLGNHDYTSRITGQFSDFLAECGIHVLDGGTAEYTISGESVGIAGTRGFRGGFGENALDETCEPETEVWVSTTQSEAAKIERGLQQLKTDYRVVMLHYSPIVATIVGVHPETYPFYGATLLCKPIDRLGADLVVHGHAHKGTHHGATPRGIPVYNVAVKVIGVPYVVLELGR